MNYEWNTRKAIENRRKHGIDFVDAIAAIEDPNRIEEIDDRFISARRATRHEQERYYQGDREAW